MAEWGFGGGYSGSTTSVYVWGLVLETTFGGNIYFVEWAGKKGGFGKLFVSVIMCKVEEKQLEAALVEK